MTEVEAEPGRLDLVLARALGVPRTEVQRAIAGGRVTVDGVVRPKSFVLAGGERVRVDLEAATDVPPEGRRSPSASRTSTCSSCRSRPACPPTRSSPGGRGRW